MKNKVLIVGTGIAGIATALRLHSKGYQVSMVEKNEIPGGRLSHIDKDGFSFDIGPTFFSMSYEFEEFAQACNMELPFKYYPIDPLYSVSLDKINPPFILYRDISSLANQFKQYEPNFESQMTKYLAHTRNLFNDTIDLVVHDNFYSLSDYFIKLSKVKKKHIPTLLSTIDKQVNKYFSSQEVRQTLSLFSYFLGTAPAQTNGVYSLLSYTEFLHDGYHYVEGGMYRIIEGLMQEIHKRNIPVIYNTEIIQTETNKKTVSALKDQHDNAYESDYYIINMDAALFRNKILHRKQYTDKQMLQKKWSMGFLTACIGLDCKISTPAMHNYFIGHQKGKLPKGHQETFLPQHPYYYVNVISQHSPQCAPKGCEALLIVIPVPNLIHKDNWEDAPSIIDKILQDFGEHLDIPILDHIKTKVIMTPENWQDRFNLYKGAGLGLNQSMSQTGYFRPHNKDEVFNNLYYCGASTVPGIGLPMAIISSKLTTERIMSI